MNKEYTYIDGKVILIDDNGNQTLTEYYDNLDDVLIQENLIETMENEIEKSNNKYLELSNETKGSKKTNLLKKVILPHAILTIIALFIPTILELLIPVPLSSTIIPNFKVWLTAFSFVLTQMPVTPMTLQNYFSYNESLKKKNGIQTELKHLNEQLMKEKQKLESLIENKTKQKENKEFRVVKVNDLEQLKELRNNIAFYYDLGYNQEKFYKYFERGNLDKKLNSYYTEEGVKEAKEYIESTAPQLVKKK